MTTAIVCTTILGALVFVLGFNVSRMRGVTAKQGGSQMPSDPASPLLIAMRAHGNAIEYVPTLIALIVLVGWRSPDWVAIPLIVGATLGRVVHAWGMLASKSLAQESMIRMVGAMATYFFGVGLAVALPFTLV
jgi:uncharacterized protein